MPLDAPNTWGQNIATAIAGLGVKAGTPVTPAQLAQMWTIIKTEDTSQLGKSSVAPGSFSNGAGPVSGVGGPVT